MDRQIRIATAADRKFIEHLQRRFSNQIGFLPHPAVDAYLDRRAYTIATENDEPAGFLLANRSLRWQPNLASITQAAVAMDAQRRAIGLDLLRDLVSQLNVGPCCGIQAVCRVDLEANAFWHAANFTPICHIRGQNARKQDLIVWRLPFTTKIPLWFASPPPRAGTRAQPPRLDRDNTRSAHAGTGRSRLFYASKRSAEETPAAEPTAGEEGDEGGAPPHRSNKF